MIDNINEYTYYIYVVKIYTLSYGTGYIRILKLSDKVYSIIKETEYIKGVQHKRGTTKKMTDTNIILLAYGEKKSDFMKRVRNELKKRGFINGM